MFQSINWMNFIIKNRKEIELNLPHLHEGSGLADGWWSSSIRLWSLKCKQSELLTMIISKMNLLYRQRGTVNCNNWFSLWYSVLQSDNQWYRRGLCRYYLQCCWCHKVLIVLQISRDSSNITHEVSDQRARIKHRSVEDEHSVVSIGCYGSDRRLWFTVNSPSNISWRCRCFAVAFWLIWRHSVAEAAAMDAYGWW